MIVDNPSITDQPETKPAGRVERRKAKTRMALIEAAGRLFSSRSAESISIAEIADEADIAVGSFYNYFATKDELLAALLETTFKEQLALLRSRQEKVTDPAEKVSIAHRHLVDLTVTSPEMAWLVVRFEVPQRIGNLALSEAARSDIHQGISEGRFKVNNPEVSLQASGGSLLAIIYAILLDQIPADAGTDHAAGVLMSLGLDGEEALEIAGRPLPPAVSG